MASIQFKAKLWASLEGKGWTFVTLPKTASAKLGARGRVPIRGTINGFEFRSSAFPDGKGSHTIMVNAAMRAGGEVEPGEIATFVLEPGSDQVTFEIPADLARALKRSATARKHFEAITPKARAEWVAWITSAKQDQTRARRLQQTFERLSAGKKRPSD